MRRIPATFTILFLLLTLTAARRDEKPWAKAEREVICENFPKSLRDSIAKEFNIGPQEKLMTSPHGQLNFTTHERLVYDAGWEFVRGGFGIFDVEKDVAGNKLTITGKAVTNNVVTNLFRMRDLVRTDCDLNGFYPYFFEQHLNEKGFTDKKTYVANTWTMYDHVNSKVYTNAKHDSMQTTITPGVQNYISMFFMVRTVKCQPGDTFSIHCFVHGKDYPVKFRCLQREKITVDAGTFNCLKIEPKLVGSGHGFTEKDKMYFWFTDDEFRMPVKLATKAKMGYITANLQAYERN